MQREHGDNLVVLLDEPGLSLHGKAQYDLLRFMREELMPKYQVLYTTHSPFMIEANNLLSCRTVEDVVTKDDEVLGTKVGSDILSTDSDTLFPLQAALGYDITQAPEKGQSEAMSAVIDLATRGRKRGYCAVLATQRLSKLHKDAAAECNNKLIGRTGLDIDRKRAAEELGFTSKEATLALRQLGPGEFFAFGPAISSEVTKVQIGPVTTSHPKAGDRILTEPTPPTDRIKAILSKLADLPEAAAAEARTVEDLQTENRELRHKLTLVHKSQPSSMKEQIDTVVARGTCRQRAIVR